MKEIIYKGKSKISMKMKDISTSDEKSILIQSLKKTRPIINSNKKY